VPVRELSPRFSKVYTKQGGKGEPSDFYRNGSWGIMCVRGGLTPSSVIDSANFHLICSFKFQEQVYQIDLDILSRKS
jgi:hypothetical protein